MTKAGRGGLGTRLVGGSVEEREGGVWKRGRGSVEGREGGGGGGGGGGVYCCYGNVLPDFSV